MYSPENFRTGIFSKQTNELSSFLYWSVFIHVSDREQDHFEYSMPTSSGKISQVLCC